MFKLRLLRRLTGWFAVLAISTLCVMSMLGSGPFPVSLTTQLFSSPSTEDRSSSDDRRDGIEAARSAVEHDLERAIEKGVDRRILADDELGRDLQPPAGPAAEAGPFTLGDDDVLDGIWARCEVGDGKACDQLFEVAPIGSDYEWFGLSCGDRPGIIDCSAELDGPG